MTHLRKVELVGTPRSIRRNRSTPYIALVQNEPDENYASHSARRSRWIHNAHVNAVAMGVMLRYLATRHDHTLARTACLAGGYSKRAAP